MRITYIGHSSFLIDHNNFKILTDPFSPFIYPYNSIHSYPVDLITISHSHLDHCYTKNLTYKTLINTVGIFKYDTLIIEGFLSYHDSHGGLMRGNNLIFVFRFRDFTLCHLGDLGHELDDELINKLGKIDILFVPVGGNITIDGETAAKICIRLDPALIIPMHYRTSNKSLPIHSLEDFLLSIKCGEYSNKGFLDITTLDLFKSKVIILPENNVRAIN